MNAEDQVIRTLSRDLRFFPVKNSNPSKLSPDQIRQYNELGYVSGFRVFNDRDVKKNRDSFDSILDEFRRSGKGSYDINRYEDRYAAIYDAATAPAILDLIQDIIGPNIICWATHYICKLPGDDMGVSWHQDCSYWALSPSKTVTAWLAIDDADRENGCMQVIPGSHLHGHIAFKNSDEDERNVLNQTIEHAEQFGKPVNVELKAGEISLHSDLLVHGSQPNRSHRRRCGLTLRYCPPDVHAYLDWNKRAIICRGADPQGHWGNIPRPRS